MSNRKVFGFFIFFAIIISLNADIIDQSKLLKSNKPFSFSRDLFFPKKTQKELQNRKNFERKEEFKIKEEKLKLKHVELFDNIIYEGFIFRQNKKIALISINGEFLTCRNGDTILDKIEIVNLSRKTLKIKIEKKEYEINIKGDEDEEN